MTQTTQQDTDFGIHSRAMLVALRISSWRATRMDKEITREVAERHGLAGDSGWYSKKLLPGAKPYDALMSVIHEARKLHYANTLAWSDEGWRLLPSANFMAHADLMRSLHSRFDSLYQDFEREYPALQDLARDALNGAFKRKDYPSIYELRRKFAFNLDYAPLPAKGDFRLDLPSDAIEQIGARVEDRVTQATRQAVEDAWARLSDTVQHIAERLSDPKNIFRDSLIANVRELTDVLTRLNVTNDPNLEKMRQRVETTVARIEPQTLRDDAEVREATAKEAQKILDDMSMFFQAPGSQKGGK